MWVSFRSMNDYVQVKIKLISIVYRSTDRIRVVISGRCVDAETVKWEVRKFNKYLLLSQGNRNFFASVTYLFSSAPYAYKQQLPNPPLPYS